MSILELGALGEFLGAFAVVITLVYLGLQVRHNTMSTRAGTLAYATDAWSDYLGDPPLAMAFLDRVVDGAILLKIQGKSYRAHRAQKPSSRQQANTAAKSP